MSDDIATWLMVGVGVTHDELHSLCYTAQHYDPVKVNTRVLFTRRTMPAFTVAIYLNEVVPSHRHMH